MTPKSNFAVLSRSFVDIYKIEEDFSQPIHIFLAKVKGGSGLPSCFRYQTINKCSFQSICVAFCFFVTFVDLVVYNSLQIEYCSTL